MLTSMSMFHSVPTHDRSTQTQLYLIGLPPQVIFLKEIKNLNVLVTVGETTLLGKGSMTLVSSKSCVGMRSDCAAQQHRKRMGRAWGDISGNIDCYFCCFKLHIIATPLHLIAGKFPRWRASAGGNACEPPPSSWPACCSACRRRPRSYFLHHRTPPLYGPAFGWME